MNRKIKKITAILMCAVMLLTAVPMSAFATHTDESENYVEIKLKKGYKDSIEPGETTEIYVEYYAGDNQDIEIIWSTPGNMCEYEYITDSKTGLLTGMKITSVSGGVFHVFVSIFDSDGNELAKDHIDIWSAEPDNKPLNEKVDEFIDMLPAKLGLLGYCLAYIVSIVVVGPVTGVLETCIVIYTRLYELINS